MRSDRASKRTWFARLVHGNDPSVDSIIVAVLFSILGLTALTAIHMLMTKEFSAAEYAGGCSLLTAALGGSKALRRVGLQKTDGPDSPKDCEHPSG